jgi:hypothetical protein
MTGTATIQVGQFGRPALSKDGSAFDLKYRRMAVCADTRCSAA